jgi:CRISPR system Cascade subunit CasE
MYLTRLILNPRNRRVQNELEHPYEMHRSILRAFPVTLSDGERMLFRVDELPKYSAPALLVQSVNMPDWSWLAEDERARGYLLPIPEPNPAIKPFDLKLAAGQMLGFRLRANATVKKDTDDGRSVRRGLLTEDEQIKWLARKAEASGFSVLSVNIVREGKVGGDIHRTNDETGKKETHDLTLLAVRFDGVLQVMDPARLAKTVEIGIGSAKGFGFGLLSLAPAG